MISFETNTFRKYIQGITNDVKSIFFSSVSLCKRNQTATKTTTRMSHEHLAHVTYFEESAEGTKEGEHRSRSLEHGYLLKYRSTFLSVMPSMLMLVDI